MRDIIFLNRFRRDMKRVTKRGYKLHKFETIIWLLASDKTLPTRCRPHKLTWNYEGFWECHIESDWLLIYTFNDEENTLDLARTWTHSDLFR